MIKYEFINLSVAGDWKNLLCFALGFPTTYCKQGGVDVDKKDKKHET